MVRKNSIEFVTDEGGGEIRDMYGATLASLGTAKKARRSFQQLIADLPRR